MTRLTADMGQLICGGCGATDRDQERSVMITYYESARLYTILLYTTGIDRVSESDIIQRIGCRARTHTRLYIPIPIKRIATDKTQKPIGKKQKILNNIKKESKYPIVPSRVSR